MLTLFRWLLMLTIGLIATLVLAVALLWYFAMRSLPDYNATYLVENVSAPVEIVRTTENVPHIFGETDEDVFFALGVAHAQDRLFQMTTLRRAAQGRLAEIYGATAFAGDDLARRLGIQRAARASLAAQDAATRAALEAYSAGINQWIAKVNEGALGRGAPEFFLYPGEIAYWQPADSLAILKLLAASASTALPDEVLRARLSLADPAKGWQIAALPGEPALPPYAGLFPGAPILPQDGADPLPDHTAALAGFLTPGAGLSGNALAVAPARTAAGGALIGNDPQAALTAPALWYLARLELQTGGVIGATIPGIPAVLSGRNPSLAWGVAPSGADDADIFVEELQPGDPTRYRSAAGWVPFQSRREIIHIRDGEDQAITLRYTGNGAVLPAGDFGLSHVLPVGHVAAIRWTGAAGDDRSVSALMGLMRAHDRAGAEAALADLVAPALSVMLADQNGIAQRQAGALPQRGPDHQSGGRLPVPGWRLGNHWLGQGPAAQVAQADVLTATGEPEGGPHLARLRRLMDSREIHSRDSMIAAQLDTVSQAARSLLPLVGANLWFTGDPAAPGTPQRQRQDALRLLAEWDGDMNEHLPEPLIYAAWMAALQDRLIRDDIGPLSESIIRLHPVFIDAVFRNRGGAAQWCDVIQSAPVEDCTTLARQALDEAILDLTARFGPDVTSWRWGDSHAAQQISPGLGRLTGLGWITNLTQSVSGGDYTLAQSGLLGHGPNPYQAITGAGYRGVYDLADPDSSVFVIATGQSGHPFSRHYDDLAGLWRRGEYIGMSLDPDLARAAAVGTTHLLPTPPAAP